MEIAYHGCIGPEHPAIPGHFPENPIVPGAVLLTELVRAVEKNFGQTARLLEISSVKFSSPLRPGDRFIIHLEPADEYQLRFTVSRTVHIVASGLIRYDNS